MTMPRAVVTEARAGIYRYDGLGGWYQTATVHQPDELQQMLSALVHSLPSSGPSPVSVRLSVDNHPLVDITDTARLHRH